MARLEGIISIPSLHKAPVELSDVISTGASLMPYCKYPMPLVVYQPPMVIQVRGVSGAKLSNPRQTHNTDLR